MAGKMKFPKAFIIVLVTTGMNQVHGRPDSGTVIIARQQLHAPDPVSHTHSGVMSRAAASEECGKSKRAPDTNRVRIIGGTTVFEHELPWQISLQIREVHFCGATVLSDKWVVTAVHCLDIVFLLHLQDHMTVVAGGHHLTRKGTEQRRKAKRMIVHPKYNSVTKENDIALLELKEPFTLDGETVSPICLSKSPVKDTSYCLVSGWGHSKEKGTVSDLLQKVSVPVISDAECKKKYAVKNYTIVDTMICAGYDKGGKDACQADSGGPLECLGEDDRYFLAGVVSWGLGCGRPDFPGVYTEVRYFLDWIKSVRIVQLSSLMTGVMTGLQGMGLAHPTYEMIVSNPNYIPPNDWDEGITKRD